MDVLHGNFLSGKFLGFADARGYNSNHSHPMERVLAIDGRCKFFVINVICHELNRVLVRRFREIDSMEYRSAEFKLSNFNVGCTETKVTQGIYQKS